jgi:hypothetical protein
MLLANSAACSPRLDPLPTLSSLTPSQEMAAIQLTPLQAVGQLLRSREVEARGAQDTTRKRMPLDNKALASLPSLIINWFLEHRAGWAGYGNSTQPELAGELGWWSARPAQCCLDIWPRPLLCRPGLSPLTHTAPRTHG